jgi:uncharacterized protein (TIGR03083 family)
VNRLRALVSVWESACTDLSRLAGQLDVLDWSLPTDLPGWSVQDVMAHCAAIESELAGIAPMRVEIDTSAAHIQNPAGIYTERGVVGRRNRTPHELVEEFEQAVSRRSVLLDDEPLDDPDGSPPITPGRIDWDWATLLRNRPIDIWVHEQDIRRAVGKPGGLETAAARHAQSTFALALPSVVAKRAAAPPGSSVVLAVTGPISATYAVLVDASGRGRASEVAPDDPTTRISMNTETFTILAAGRREPATLPIRVEGARSLGESIITKLGVLPF